MTCTNVLFVYLYRDAHNYKRHYSLVFENPEQRSLEEIDAAIRAALTDGEWFDHTRWNAPDLHFETFSFETDHPWHEYSHVEWSHQPASTICGTINDFLLHIAQHNY